MLLSLFISIWLDTGMRLPSRQFCTEQVYRIHEIEMRFTDDPVIQKAQTQEVP